VDFSLPVSEHHERILAALIAVIISSAARSATAPRRITHITEVWGMEGYLIIKYP